MEAGGVVIVLGYFIVECLEPKHDHLWEPLNSSVIITIQMCVSHVFECITTLPWVLLQEGVVTCWYTNNQLVRASTSSTFKNSKSAP